jgi:hypothetical protein
MTIGEILDRSFRLYRNFFLKLFIAVLVPMCVEFIVLQIAMGYSIWPLYEYSVSHRDFATIDPAMITNALVGGLVFLVVHALVNLLFLGAQIHLISAFFLQKPVTVADAYRLTLRRFGALLGVNWIKFSILSTCLVLWIVPIGIALWVNAWWVVGAWVIMGALPLLFAYLWFALASLVLLLDQTNVKESIRRSGRLMFVMSEKGVLRNNSFRVSIILLIIFVIKFFVMLLSYSPLVIWKMMTVFKDPSLQGLYHRTPLDSVFEFVNMVMQAATTPFGLAVLVLFYYDIRIRKEGLDLSLRLNWLRGKLKMAEAPKT